LISGPRAVPTRWSFGSPGFNPPGADAEEHRFRRHDRSEALPNATKQIESAASDGRLRVELRLVADKRGKPGL
jgi:hypothetical protein